MTERVFIRGETSEMEWWEELVHNVLSELIDFNKLVFIYTPLGLEKILVIGDKKFIVPKPIYWKIDEESIRSFLSTLIRIYQIIDFDFHDEFEYLLIKYIPVVGYENAIKIIQKYLEEALNNDLFFSAVKSSFLHFGEMDKIFDKFKISRNFYGIPGILTKIGIFEYEYIVGAGIHVVVLEDENQLEQFKAVIKKKREDVLRIFLQFE